MEDEIFCCLTSVEELETSLAIDSNFALAALVVSFLCSALLKNLPTSAFCFSSRSLLSLKRTMHAFKYVMRILFSFFDLIIHDRKNKLL